MLVALYLGNFKKTGGQGEGKGKNLTIGERETLQVLLLP
jgi:hypothetical protein